MPHPGIEAVRALVEASGVDDSSIEASRAHLEASVGTLAPPDGVDVVPLTLGGRPAEALTGPDPAGGSVLYLHGGAYCVGSPNTHRELAGRLALATGARIVTLDYRLAPEHPCPAAVDDARAAATELAADEGGADQVALAGDSAGGGLVLATLLAARDAGDALPAAAVCLSPWTDLTLTAPSYDSRGERDFMVDRENLRSRAAAYLGGRPADDPLASPLFADLRGLPPLLVHVGDDEVLLDDSVRLADRARRAGVDVELRVFPEMVHVFQAFPSGLLPETDESVAEIAAFLRTHLA